MPGQMLFFSFQTIGYNGVMVGGCNQEFYGSLIGRIIRAGQPIMRPVWPVIAEKCPVSELVFGDDQPISRNAGIIYSIGMHTLCRCRCIDYNNITILPEC